MHKNLKSMSLEGSFKNLYRTKVTKKLGMYFTFFFFTSKPFYLLIPFPSNFFQVYNIDLSIPISLTVEIYHLLWRPKLGSALEGISQKLKTSQVCVGIPEVSRIFCDWLLTRSYVKFREDKTSAMQVIPVWSWAAAPPSPKPRADSPA